MNASVGIIGGMGPMASQLFYKKVTEHTKAEKDQDHIKLILLSDAQMPDRTQGILSGEYTAVYERMLEDAKFLEESGCQALAVTCNTAHFYCNMVQDKIGIPFLHMIRLTSKNIASTNPGGVIGVMATDGTIKTELYQKALIEQGLTPFKPKEEIQKEVMHQIYDCIKSGKPYDSISWKKIEEEFRQAGCEKVILACTELSVIKADENLSDWYIDPMDILARAVIEFSGKEYI